MKIRPPLSGLRQTGSDTTRGKDAHQMWQQFVPPDVSLTMTRVKSLKEVGELSAGTNMVLSGRMRHEAKRGEIYKLLCVMK